MNKTRTTMYDVAKAAGVSGPAVSVVLNNRTESTIKVSAETRERILQAARDLNYTPSILGRGLAERKSFVIGLLLSEINSHFVADVIRGVQDIATEQRYSPVVYIHGGPGEETTEFERCLDRQVDGLIVDTFDLPADRTNVERYCDLAKSGFPVVELFGTSIPDVPRVNVDFQGDGRCAAEYLIKQGHQRIALVIHDQYQRRQIHWAAWGFYSGYQAAMTEAGLEPIIITAPAIVTSPSALAFVESGRRAAQSLAAQADKPTAAICYSNRRAFGLFQGLRDAGLNVPDDMSVVGYYEREIAELTNPRLTSLVVASRRAGQMAAETVFSILEGNTGVTASVASDWITGGTVLPISSMTHNAGYH